MSYAHDLIERHFARLGGPGEQALDAAYQYEMTVLRDMVCRLEVILDDEDVPRETARRVLRCLLYGAPSPAGAELRMRQEEEMAALIERTPPMPPDFTSMLGLPPR